ncbi:coiled-coil domain-containing protein 107 [Phyllopteryx taeniolatus]|uniref:coiled-coil domain-containing protein 107 n=1 Tax=Phyllopteryx taeniolatus TaxID=161469 RepID=UPI002AD20177|nr:coiled-coil domain-containing protein 107 [Phyllopteryx taeniolatus]
MVLSTSQQVALAFTAVLFTFVVLPKMFGVGTGAKETRLEPRYSRKGGPSVSTGAPSSHQSAESVQQMKRLMEQELKADKFKSNNNSKGYVFTLMPLYAIGVGVFAAYKFLKIKSSDDQAQKDKFAKGAKKSAEAENQLSELEQRLAQTERMLNSILIQLDPLTNCAKSVAQDQKNEILTQLQTIRYLMKKRGMDCPPLNESCFEQSLDHLIETLGARETSPHADKSSEKSGGGDMKEPLPERSEEETAEGNAGDAEEEDEEADEEERTEEEEGYEEFDVTPSLEDANHEDGGQVRRACGLRRRIVPE